MKKIKIPLVFRSIEIFIGKKEYSSFVNTMKKMGGEPLSKEDLSERGGFAFGSVIWVSDLSPYILFHELSHALNCIFNHLAIKDEDEFTSHIWGYVTNEIFKVFKKEFLKTSDKWGDI